jgi:glutamate-1-semialdehyde 2,1-aminomutase
MKPRDHGALISELEARYTKRSSISERLNREAKSYLLDGGSHALRLIRPFPPRIVSARGAWVEDEDGHRILDFWQGHHANLLGHNPEVVTSALAARFQEGFGLQTGFADRLQLELAEIMCRQTDSEKIRFTTSGSLATMYSILLARAYTDRQLVMKVGGGWHGAQPWGLKGVAYETERHLGFQQVDSEGLPAAVTDEIVVTQFNNTELLHDHFKTYGDRLACFIVEPFIGAGGFIPATGEYLRAARELSDKHGTVLIFDEVISGFRFRAGNVGKLYGVKPDLATFGKIMSGGMPLSAVAGRSEIMSLCSSEGGNRVRFSGGTYSAHPACLFAAKAFQSHLVAHEEEIYPYLSKLGDTTRRAVEAAFQEEGIYACCTGYGNEDLAGASLSMLLFPYEEGSRPNTPEDTHDPRICDVVLTDRVIQLAFLMENIHVVHGLGSVSTAHTEDEIGFLIDACRKVARLIRPRL